MSDFYTEEGDKVFVVTQTGWRLECLPMAENLLRVGENIQEPIEPEPPTYTVTDISGDKEQFPHDEQSIEDESTSQEEKAAWVIYVTAKAEYEQQIAENEARRTEMRARYMALRAVRVVDIPPDKALKSWAKEQRELFGLAIGDNLKLEFINQEVIRTAFDGQKIMSGVLKATGLDQETLDTVEESFRNPLENANGPDADADSGETEESE